MIEREGLFFFVVKMIGVIGGSSLLGADLFGSLAVREVGTSAGAVSVRVGENVVFVQRHSTVPGGGYELPHTVRHRAVAEALQTLGVKRVVGVASVGEKKDER